MRLKKELLVLATATILATTLIWLPFAFGQNGGMLTVFKNYDGPNYLIIAKSWYDKSAIASHFSLSTPLEYYPAHLPGYPLTIALMNSFLPGPQAMLFSTLLLTLFCVIGFYLFLFKFRLSENPLWLSLVFLFLPARWVVVKAVGSPEPQFIFAIVASFYFFKSALDKTKNNLLSGKKSVCLDLLLAGIFGVLAQITKTPGILLFFAYLLYLSLYYIIILIYYKLRTNKKTEGLQKPPWQSLVLLIIPLSLIPVFWFYKIRTNDFFAYFHSGDNFHLIFPPFQSFSQNRSWLGDFWREDMVWQYLLGALTVVLLIKQKLYDLASFAGVFFAATLFVAHRDLARYSLPLVPFSLIAFDKLIQRREFKIALLIILPAIYLYAVNFIAGNIAPIADWTPYL